MKRILLAEDNLPSRELVREILETLGYQVIEACDGGEALDKVRGNEPDLVLMDIQMPVMDGFAVLSQLRKEYRFLKLPVIALTAYAMEGDREKILEAGFDGYATKPINAATLSCEIQRWLEGTSSLTPRC